MHRELNKRVMAAARQPCVETLTSYLKMVNWVECCYSNGDTPLHVAAKEGNVEVIKLLLESSSPEKNFVDVPNASGKTPLHEACQNAQPTAVDYLLSKGANSRAIKQADWTPLMLAASRKGPEALQCCEILIQTGGLELLGDKNKDGWNALHIAAREGDIAIVKTLLEEDVMQAVGKSNNGRTPLHTAALHGCNEVVKVLLDYAPSACNARDSCGSTPLHDAVRSGKIETVKILVQAGADLDACNHQGYGVLHMAAEVGNEVMLMFLCKDLKVFWKPKDEESISTPLHCAVRSGQLKAAQALLCHGVSPSTRDAWGRTCQDIIPENISQEDYDAMKELLATSRIKEIC